MKTEPEYQLDEFLHNNGSGWISRFNYTRLYFSDTLTKMFPLYPPIRRKSIIKHLTTPLTMKELGKAAGLVDVKTQHILEEHQKRYNSFKNASSVATLFLLLLFLAMEFAIIPFLKMDFSSSIIAIIVFTIYMVTTVVVSFLGTAYVFRLVAFLTEKYYADTLCIVSCIYLLLELSKENTLVLPNLQRGALFRTRILARSILLLPYCYEGTNSSNNVWAQAYFGKIESRVREYERWVISPKENTLSDLRKEVNELTHTLLHRNFEDASYEIPALPESVSQGRLGQFTSLVSRIVGIAVPGFILGMLYLYPDQINNTGLDKNIVGLISLAWILLTIDAILDLGVVERISGLAKAIKDLK